MERKRGDPILEYLRREPMGAGDRKGALRAVHGRGRSHEWIKEKIRKR